MTELEIGKKYWIKGILESIDEDDPDCPYEFYFKGKYGTGWFRSDVEIVEAIPEREKVTIPKEVAEWIEEHKGQFSTVYTAFSILTKREYGIKKWVNDNQDTFARAWLDGYEIEKKQEPLGVLLVDMPENVFRKYNFLYRGSTGKFSVNGSDTIATVGEQAHKVTEAEAKEKYPNFKWVSLEELENED